MNIKKLETKAKYTFTNYSTSNKPKVFNNKNTGKEFCLVELFITQDGEKILDEPTAVELFFNKFYNVNSFGVAITTVKEFDYRLTNKATGEQFEVDGETLDEILFQNGFNVKVKETFTPRFRA